MHNPRQYSYLKYKVPEMIKEYRGLCLKYFCPILSQMPFKYRMYIKH